MDTKQLYEKIKQETGGAGAVGGGYNVIIAFADQQH